MDTPRWEYRIFTVKIYEKYALERWLNELGIAGWELVSLSTTVKTWLNVSGNDLIAVLKRPGAEPADREHKFGAPESAWHNDPTGRHSERYWDGSQWTGRVRDAEVESNDPLP